MPPWQAAADHLKVQVRLTPKSSADRIDGRIRLADGREVLAVRVRAAPEAGLANAALIRTVAAALDVARSAVAVTRGHEARLKQLRVDGYPAELTRKAERLWPETPAP